jgi:hypothetical protein
MPDGSFSIRPRRAVVLGRHDLRSILPISATHRRLRMTGDHQVLVGFYH